jgi:hypothetical protein
MAELSVVIVSAAALGAVLALVAVAGRLSRRLSADVVDRLYYASYACAGVGVALFLVRGLLGGGG